MLAEAEHRDVFDFLNFVGGCNCCVTGLGCSTLKEEQAAHFINTCCRLGHPALAIAALSTGAKGQGTYSAVLNDTDSEPTEIRLPKNLGPFLLQSLNLNAFIPHFDEWGLEARDGNADDVRVSV